MEWVRYKRDENIFGVLYFMLKEVKWLIRVSDYRLRDRSWDPIKDKNIFFFVFKTSSPAVVLSRGEAAGA